MSFEPPPEEELPPEEDWVPPEDSLVSNDALRPESGEDGGDPVFGVEVLPEILVRLGNVETIAADCYDQLANYPAGGPWFWHELNGNQRAELWAELETFVTWLQNRILCHWSNPEGSIAPCWYLHPDAVELLTALMVAHKAAYRHKSKKPSFELTEWFTRGLWPTMDAFARRSTFKNCIGQQEHQPSTGGVVLEENSAAFSDFVSQDTTQPAYHQQSSQGGTSA